MGNRIKTTFVAKIKNAINNLPKILANEAVNYSLDAFKAQSWDGNTWQGRKGGKGGKRALLVKSGRLRRSPRAENITNEGFNLSTDVPYARVHNEGFTGSVTVQAHTRNSYGKGKVTSINERTKSGRRKTKTVRWQNGAHKVKSHTRKMNIPQRKFMGKTDALVRRMIYKGQIYIYQQVNAKQ